MRPAQSRCQVPIEPVSETLRSSQTRARMAAGSDGEFATSGLRLHRILALTSLAFLLTSSAALAHSIGAIVDADQVMPNAGITVPQANANSELTTPPAANDKPNESQSEPSATVPPAATAPVPKPDQPLAEPEVPAAIAAPAPHSEPPVAASSVDADAPIVEQLRDLANGKFDRIVGSAQERTAIDAFYSRRNYAPLWITDGKANARAKAAIAYLGQVEADGLDPADYPVPNFDSLTDAAALAEAEIGLTTSVLAYAHHAQIGRVHWSRVSPDISYDRSAPDSAEVLANITKAEDVSEALDAYEPHVAGYLALKAKLAEIRTGWRNSNKARIPSGPPLKIGMSDERVPLLRSRLDVAQEGDTTTYDKALADAVKKFQAMHNLRSTGTVDAATVEALNSRPSDRQADIIIANMERWRWMPRDLGKTYVIVNLPDYTLRVMHDGKQVWMTKIVVGKLSTPTPIMSAQMKSITVNPTWNVPQSIADAEYLPLLQQDPTILERMGLRVSYNPDGTIHLSQPPGEQNALGQLRFNFPNKFLVYQHDSNQKYLFAKDKRADSHGCMRVEDPLKYAEVLLSIVRPGEGYTQDRIHRMFGNYEIDIPFPTPIPVHLTYQTAFVDDRGKLEFREDIYGRDQALLAIMKGPEAKVADIPLQRKESTARRQPVAIATNPWGGPVARGYVNGLNFFSRLFGAPAQTAPVPQRPVTQHRAYYQ
jgi:L,D-transpeptidase YcbB